MAKRSSSKGNRDIRLSETQMRQPGMKGSARVEQELAAPVAGGAPKLAEEYSYVISDLQRIAIIALVMLAVLVVLALALP